MDDVATLLRERVHGVTAAAPAKWDESKVKGYDPNWDESKVKRDTDPGEEGQFAKKDGATSQSEKDRRSFLKWYAKQPKEVQEFLTWLNKQPKDVKDWFIQLSKLSAKERRALLGLDDLPDVREMRNGAINLRQNLPKEDQARIESRANFDDPKPDGDLTKPAPAGDRPLEEDEVPKVGPNGAKLVDFAHGVARYDDGSTYDKDGWHKPMKASITATATSAWKADKRKDAAVKGQALPDGSYPIKDKTDWYKAKQAIGRAGPGKRAAVIAHLRKRAKALGIPESELEGLTAAGFDPNLHPRARDGKFIEVGGWVKGLFNWGDPKTGDREWRGKVTEILPNPKDPKDPIIVIKPEDGPHAGKEGRILSSNVTEAVPTKADLSAPSADAPAADEPAPEVKQLSLADAPVTGPPGTRPDLGTPGMVKQNVATKSDDADIQRAQEAIDALNTALGERGNDDGQRTAANDLADLRDELKDNPEASKMIEDAIANSGIPEFFDGAPDEQIANSPDDLYANLYDQPDDLEQFPEAADTPPDTKLSVAPDTQPSVVKGPYRYAFDEGNWSNAEVWRWNDETGEGEMIGRANLVNNGQARFVRNGEDKPFPKNFDTPEALLEVAAETDTPPVDEQRALLDRMGKDDDAARQALRDRVHNPS